MSEEKKWTDEQIMTFQSDSSDILVSAAAGSGKTAVLTERLIRKLTDPVSPLSVDEILVVTFAKDAANELKQRIREALGKAVAKEPSNKRLRREYMKLSGAKITTIDGFCFELVKQNYDVLGLSPKLKVSDETQSALLKQQVADAVIDDYYAGTEGYDDISDFTAFADNFINLQDTSLKELLLRLYEKLTSFPDGTDFLRKSAEEYDKVSSSDRGVWGRLILGQLNRAISFYYEIIGSACEEFADGGIFEAKYLPAFYADKLALSKIIASIDKADFDLIASELNIVEKCKLGSVPTAQQDSTTDFYKEVRSGFHDTVAEFKKKFFDVKDETLKASAEISRSSVYDLYRFVSAFERRYTKEKQKRGLLDFSDMQRYAYNLLVGADGEPTETAHELSSRFKEVCIDEYQDVNGIQDSIFAAVSCNSNRFMVGDIKQSIYAFRGSQPEIFASYRSSSDIDLISLTKNFRSDNSVLDFANEVCGSLFTKLGTTVPYNDSDRLNFSKSTDMDMKTELTLINTKNQTIDSEDDPEAKYVALRIKELLSDGVKPSDIAILLRATRHHSQKYENELKKLGIPCKNNVKPDLFVNPEVLLLMSILNVIDNPTRDIHLAGALKSPIYNVTLSELVQIREHKKNCSLYEALKAYTAEHKSFAKGLHFLNKLSEYRSLANEPVDKLIWHILCDSGLLAMSGRKSEDHKDGRANLLALYEHARNFESGTFKGVYNFIRYINDLIDTSSTLPSPPSSEKDEKVKIMSIHKSKGLQFKYVFLSNTASKFDGRDSTQNVILNSKFGTTLKLSDSTGLGTVDTFFRRASAMGIAEENLDEQIRILYVALTRAEEKVIVTGKISGTSTIDSLAMYRRYSGVGHGYVFSKKPSYINWILLSQNTVQPTVINADEVFSDTPKPFVSQDEPTSEIVEELTEEYYRLFKERFGYVYPNQSASIIPAKLSVSELYPSIIDDYGDDLKLYETKKARMKKPRFAEEDDYEKGAMIGTATHQFMQFCDFTLLNEFGVNKEIERLKECGYISDSVSRLVNEAAVEKFLLSRLFREMLSSDKIMRELRFNVHLDASMFSQRSDVEKLDGKTILVQGVIDCLFTDANGDLILLDYKTDHIPKNMPQYDAVQMLIDRHSRQLSYYSKAIETIAGKAPDKVILYSFGLGEEITVPKEALLRL